jgi:MFS transporter, FHS family, glucose/mannose:H+ symporter
VTGERRPLVVTEVCTVCFASGFVLASLGPALPDFAARLNRPLGDMGALFTMIFLGALVAQVATGAWADRLGPRPLLLAGLASYATGAILLGISRSAVAFFGGAALAGVGWGLASVTSNVLAAHVARRRAVVLNLINFWYAAGAIVGPIAVAVAIRRLAFAGAAIIVGATLLMLSLALAWRVVPRGSIAQRPAGDSAGGTELALRLPVLWLLGALAFLYVGIENAIGGWAPAYLTKTLGYDVADAAVRTSSFWGAFCVGRLLATGAGLTASAATLLRLGLVTASIAGIILVTGVGRPIPTLIALALLGLAFAPVYAGLVDVVTSTFARQPATALSIVSALGGAGGMVIPWLQGVLLDRAGGRAMAWFVAGVGLAMLASAEGARRWRDAASRSESQP